MPVETPRYEEMQQVVELYVQNVNPTQIAKRLGLRRVDVLNHIDEWKQTAVGMDVMKDRVETLIAGMDEHYSTLIRKAYEIIEEVDKPVEDGDRKETMTRSQMLSQKKAALDLIAKLEKDRIDILQKSGLLEIDALGDELAQMEEEKQIILDILQNDLCDHCKPKVMGKIGQMLSDNAKGNVVVVQE
jgi:hypothetical protein